MGAFPKFVRQTAQLGEQMRQAVADYNQSVREGTFPNDEESFDDVAAKMQGKGKEAGVLIRAPALPSVLVMSLESTDSRHRMGTESSKPVNGYKKF